MQIAIACMSPALRECCCHALLDVMQLGASDDSSSSDESSKSASQVGNSPDLMHGQQRQLSKADQKLASVQQQLEYAKNSNWQLKNKINKAKGLLPHLKLVSVALSAFFC